MKCARARGLSLRAWAARERWVQRGASRRRSATPRWRRWTASPRAPPANCWRRSRAHFSRAAGDIQGDMIAKERELLHEVADAVGALMEFWGFKRLMGRVWTLLFLRGEPLSAAELCEQLEISSGAASMTLSEMEHWGVVVRLRKPGDRREYFEAESDIWKMISRVMRERELMQIERALEVFERARSQ